MFFNYINIDETERDYWRHSWNSCLVMRHGFMNITSKLSNNQASGTTKVSWNRRKHVEVVQKSRWCSSFHSRIVHHEFILQGQTVNKEYCLAVLKHLCEVIRDKRPSYFNMIVTDFLTKRETRDIAQCSPDLTLRDSSLFSKLKNHFRSPRHEAFKQSISAKAQ